MAFAEDTTPYFADFGSNATLGGVAVRGIFDDAYADPLGSQMPDVPSMQGTLTEALAWEKGVPAPRWYDRVSPRVADPLFRQRVLGER